MTIAKVKRAVKHLRRLESWDGYLKGPIERYEPGRLRVYREPIPKPLGGIALGELSESPFDPEQFVEHHNEIYENDDGSEIVILHIYRQRR